MSKSRPATSNPAETDNNLSEEKELSSTELLSSSEEEIRSDDIFEFVSDEEKSSSSVDTEEVLRELDELLASLDQTSRSASPALLPVDTTVIVLLEIQSFCLSHGQNCPILAAQRANEAQSQRRIFGFEGSFFGGRKSPSSSGDNLSVSLGSLTDSSEGSLSPPSSPALGRN